MTAVRSARPPWSDVVLVCRKCARKVGRKRFAKELKTDLKRAGQGKTIRVVESGCLDLCPKRRLTIASGTDLAAGRLTVLSADVPIAEVTRHVVAQSDGSRGRASGSFRPLTHAIVGPATPALAMPDPESRDPLTAAEPFPKS